MKNWKRFAALGMAVAVTGGMMTGCGGSDTAEETTTAAAAADGETTEAAEVADSGEKKEIYVFIRDRGDLSYWDSMAEGADRAVTDYADRANVHVVETTGYV